jgi:membrane protease YdiL (CAAX protease family)
LHIDAQSLNDAGTPPPNPWPALLFCMTLPTLMSWAETRWILPTPAEERTSLQTYLFISGKVVQFIAPFLFVLFTEPKRLRSRRPSRRGMGVALLFALVVALGMFALYFGFLRGTVVFEATAAKMNEWLDKFHVNSAGGFLTFALVLSIMHSFLEEYYWRWFVFGWLRRRMAWPAAAALSSLAFMSHHVLVLSYYLPGYFWIAVMPFALCVAVGGFVWAWIYQKSENLYAAWLSHLSIDAAIMAVGWDMLLR